MNSADKWPGEVVNIPYHKTEDGLRLGNIQDNPSLYPILISSEGNLKEKVDNYK